MSKVWFYVLTALGTLASSYFFNFLFFLLADRYGFTDRENLWVAALHGAVYIGAAVYGGRFAERRGYLTSLEIGFVGLALCLTAGAWVSAMWAVLLLVVVYTFVLLFTWPALEALVVEGEAPDRVPDRVGLYNCTWSGTAAVAYFSGGPLYDALGARAIFGIPAAIYAVGALLAVWLRGRSRTARSAASARTDAPVAAGPIGRVAESRQKVFLELAWLANPLAYIAIYALLAMMPGLATRLGLSASEAGLYGSIWFFARLVAFFTLWHWPGWHYRFRWLAGSYAALTVALAACLLAPSITVLIAGQVVFGLATGLIYYSSLFYAMDVGSAQAEHGGWHEALIGIGICAGPSIGGLSLLVFPGVPSAGAWAVTGALAVGGWVLARKWVGSGRS